MRTLAASARRGLPARISFPLGIVHIPFQSGGRVQSTLPRRGAGERPHSAIGWV